MALRSISARIVGTVLFVMFGGCGILSSPSVPGDEFMDLKCPGRLSHVAKVSSFHVIGHRGAAGKAIENTIPSMQAAIDDGASAVELDLVMTSDGEVVLWHDWDPNTPIALIRQVGREPNVRYRPRVPAIGNEHRRSVDKLTLAELRAHYGYAELSGTPVPAEIPTFEQFVEWAKKEPTLKLVLLDMKVPGGQAELAGKMVEKMERVLDGGNMPFRRVYLTLHDRVWKEISPRIKDEGLSLDKDPGLVPIDEGMCSMSSSDNALERGRGYATSVHPTSWGHEDWKHLKRLLKCDLKARDEKVGVKQVFAATVDEPDKMRCLMDMGVDGLVTNFPARLYQLALARGQKAPTL